MYSEVYKLNYAEAVTEDGHARRHVRRQDELGESPDERLL